MWHFDGNHKLIRWHFVVHGCIDGYSRIITFLHCSTNNTASTVLSLFTGAVETYGLPQKVRSDLGGGGDLQYGDERVVLTGSSTHNERIERLWKDVFRCVGKLFYDLFYALEEEQALDHLNETDIYCLHYIFVPKINNCLQEFVECWNHHRLSSEHSHTPYQLLLTGNFAQRDGDTFRDHSQVRIPYFFRVSDSVVVPRSTFQPCQNLLTMMEYFIDLDSFRDFGVSSYKQCVSLV